MKKLKKILLFLVFVATVLVLPEEVSATTEQFKQWRLAYDSRCDCYQWREFLVIVLPYTSTGTEGEQTSEIFRHPDPSGDAFTLGACDVGVCVLNVKFEDYPMHRCISVTWAKLVRIDTVEDGYVVVDFEHNFTLQRKDAWFVATLTTTTDNDSLNASNYALTLDCSKFEPVPFN